MSKYKEYEKIKTKIQDLQGTVGAYQEINYGIQFDVTLQGLTSKIRVYESKKKGVTLDLSQVKHQSIKEAIVEGSLSTQNEVVASGYMSDQFDKALIGVDESGKGDYFGPLAIAAVYGDEAMKKQLLALGVTDSKKLSDKQIAEMANQIKKICPYEVLVIEGMTYNKLYYKLQNLNILLAKGHSKLIDTLAKRTGAKLALSDQFANEKLIQDELKHYQTPIVVEQRPRAETNVVVAAASILARDAFVQTIERLETEYGQPFPKGAGTGTVEAAKRFVMTFGKAELVKVAKLHFKTTEQL